ncbi:MAG: hypothetical protein JNM14_04420 [Ferruginibacter sp.]|nr:hypothetical protein [Ferruginibacter sp.]
MKKLLSALMLLLFTLPAFAQLNAEQAAIKKVFFDFLAFYKKNEAKFNSFKLYKGTGEENNPPYKLQWKEAEKYFTYLRTNVPFVGEAYINAERNHFKDSEKNFKDYPEEELPSGFDYDRWAGGQESIEYTYKWYTSKANKYKVIINGNKATLKIGSGSGKDMSWSVVPFAKENGKWKMADNIYPADDGN